MLRIPAQSTIVAEDRFDVLGVAVYIEPVRQVTDRSIDVPEIVITDHSSDQVMIISAWNDLAVKECVLLEQMIHSFPVVGFTSLKATLHKGFALSITMSTLLILDPKGEKAQALEVWASSHLVHLLDCEAQVRQVRMPSTQRIITTLQIIKSKKVPHFDNKDVRMYLGCSKCSKRCDGERAAVIQCACNRSGCTVVPRMNYNFDAHDSTGSLAFTAFTEDAETLLTVKAEAAYDMPDEVTIHRYLNVFYKTACNSLRKLQHCGPMNHFICKLVQLQHPWHAIEC